MDTPKILEDVSAQLAGLEFEKTGYEATGRADRAKEVSAEIARLKKAASSHARSTATPDAAPENADA